MKYTYSPIWGFPGVIYEESLRSPTTVYQVDNEKRKAVGEVCEKKGINFFS